MDSRMWIGKDEYEGIPSSPRKDLAPPPHWRLETVAVTERPRSLTIGADGRTLVFIQDRPDTSDVWTMTLDGTEIELHQGVEVYVPRGIKHKAVGNLTVLTVCIPRGVFNDIHELE